MAVSNVLRIRVDHWKRFVDGFISGLQVEALQIANAILIVPLVLSASASLASCLSAHRFATVDEAEALRSEWPRILGQRSLHSAPMQSRIQHATHSRWSTLLPSSSELEFSSQHELPNTYTLVGCGAFLAANSMWLLANSS